MPLGQSEARPVAAADVVLGADEAVVEETEG